MHFRKVRALLDDVRAPGRFADGTPHWRAQNQLSHGCLGLLGALFALDAGLSPVMAVSVSAAVGAAWEAVMLVCAALRDGAGNSHVLKSAADIVFYIVGATIIAVDDPIGRAEVVALLFVLLAAWATLGRTADQDGPRDAERRITGR